MVLLQLAIPESEPYAREAALEIARRIGGVWSLLAVFRRVPRPIRNAVYDWIARHRYRWFGKTEACMIPRPEWKKRFV